MILHSIHDRILMDSNFQCCDKNDLMVDTLNFTGTLPGFTQTQNSSPFRAKTKPQDFRCAVRSGSTSEILGQAAIAAKQVKSMQKLR
jgi:hypothetical protein